MKVSNLLFYLLFLAASCQHSQLIVDIASEPNCRCINLPPIEGATIGYQFYSTDSAYFTRPFPNPNNADEFLFIHRNRNQRDVLYSYNFNTKQKKKLLESQILFVPKWGKNNWILVNQLNNQIWKLKSNGDSLQQLTLTAPNYAPEWDYDCKKIIFYKDSDNPYSYIMNLNGNELDSIRFNAAAGGDWNHPSGFFIRQGFVANGNVYITDIVNKKTIADINIDNGEPLGVTWINGEKIFASTLDGLYLVDVKQKISKKLRCACKTNYYLFPRYWQQRKKIIVGRVKQTRLGDLDVKIERHIVIMDIDGTNEEVIDIPQ